MMATLSPKDQLELDALKELVTKNPYQIEEKSVLTSEVGKAHYAELIHIALGAAPELYEDYRIPNVLGSAGMKSILEICGERGGLTFETGMHLRNIEYAQSGSSQEMKDYAKSDEYLNLFVKAIERTVYLNPESFKNLYWDMGSTISNKLPLKNIEGSEAEVYSAEIAPVKKVEAAQLSGVELDYAVSFVTNPEWDFDDRISNTLRYIDTGEPEDKPYSPTSDGNLIANLLKDFNIELTKTALIDGKYLWRATIDLDEGDGMKVSAKSFDQWDAICRVVVMTELNEVEIPIFKIKEEA